MILNFYGSNTRIDELNYYFYIIAFIYGFSNKFFLSCGNSCRSVYEFAPEKSQIQKWIEDYKNLELTITDEEEKTRTARISGIIKSPGRLVCMDMGQVSQPNRHWYFCIRFESGKTFYLLKLLYHVSLDEYGVTSGTVTFSFEDENGEVTEQKLDINTEVKEPQIVELKIEKEKKETKDILRQIQQYLYKRSVSSWKSTLFLKYCILKHNHIITKTNVDD